MMVSVLLPFLNAKDTLDTSIASIAHQSFKAWRLLLIDNASVDGSRAIALDWACRDPRIQLIDEARIGIAYALNTGLAHAEGPYIARMDADDISHPRRLEEQVAFLNAHPEVGVLGARTSFVSSVAECRGMRAFVDWQNTILTPHEHFVKRFVDAPLAHPTVMFRRHLVQQHGGYSTGPVPEDHELWLRWMDAGIRFANLREEWLTGCDHATRPSRTHPHYGPEAFMAIKVKWLTHWLERHLNGRPLIIAGTSRLCLERAHLLSERGVPIHAFTDVSGRPASGYPFIPHDELPSSGKAFVLSFISQRGTGDRIASYLSGRGLVEGADFLLAA